MRISDVLETELFSETASDGLIEGNANQECKGIIVTFLATIEVLKKAVNLDANLIISHEGIYYSHDNIKFLENSNLAKAKQDYIKKQNLAIYRHHDTVHKMLPDIITKGLVKKLRLIENITHQQSYYTICKIAPICLKDYVELLKKYLEIPTLEYLGDDNQIIKNICIVVGYRGSSENLIPVIENKNVDLIIYGEGPEWEMPYYIQDYNEVNVKPKALAIIGHELSEKYGMQLFMETLKQKFPELNMDYI